MIFTGRFVDGLAIFECPICGASIVMCPSYVTKHNYRRIRHGNIHASHSAYITLDVVEAALSREIWPQPPRIHEKLEKWAQAGGGPPITLDGLNIKPAGAGPGGTQ